MTYADIAEGFSESESNAFELLLKKYAPLMNNAVKKYGDDYHRHCYGSTDRDDLMQIARIALHDAYLRFDPAKVSPDKSPEYVFTRFAANTIKGNLSDHFRKAIRYTTVECFIIDQEKAPDFPGEALPDRLATQGLENKRHCCCRRRVRTYRLILEEKYPEEITQIETAFARN